MRIATRAIKVQFWGALAIALATTAAIAQPPLPSEELAHLQTQPRTSPGAPQRRPSPLTPRRPTQPPERDMVADAQQAQPSRYQRDLGPQSSAPYMIGDLFGGSSITFSIQPPSIPFPQNIMGFGMTPNPGDPFSPVSFFLQPTPGQTPYVVSLVPGMDLNADGLAETYPIPEPPGSAPMPPIPGNVVYVGGIVTFVNDAGQIGMIPPQAAMRPEKGFELFFSHLFIPDPIEITVPSPGAGGGLGRVKTAENDSPLPGDRMFFNYSLFDNAPLGTGVTVGRYIPGFEKTFCDGMLSFQMRFPFGSTVDNDVLLGGVADSGNMQFGNIAMPIKVLLMSNDVLAFTAGLQISLPTAADSRVLLPTGTELVRVENEAVHLAPFLAALYTPSPRFFAQGFVQVDFDANGNSVHINDFTGALSGTGKLHDSTFLFLDGSIGYWMIRNPSARFLTGVAPMVELHYNHALDTPEFTSSSNMVVSTTSGRSESLNLVVGSQFQIGLNASLTLGYATPLAGDPVDDFDGELRAIFNYRFGAPFRGTPTVY